MLRFQQNYNAKFLKAWPYYITILILLVVFAIYSYSIFTDRLYLGSFVDKGARFLIAMQYAHEPSKALELSSWVAIWPPVPFIIQSFILRLVLFQGISDINLGIKVVELTSVNLVLVGFFFISRSVALQTNDVTGILACLLCLCTPLILELAHTPMSEGYSFFFVSLAIYSILNYLLSNEKISYIIAIVCFVLAYFCRTETLFFSLIFGVFLIVHKRWKLALLLVGITISVALAQILGANFLIQGNKIYDREIWGEAPLERLRQAQQMLIALLRYNKKLILLSLVWIIPLIYFQFRRRANAPRNIQPNFIYTLRRFRNWLVNEAIAIWTILFVFSLAFPIILIIRGGLTYQPRFMFWANIFMNIMLALIIARTNYIISSIRNKKIAKPLVIASLTLITVFSLSSGIAYASASEKIQKMPSDVKDVIHFVSKNQLSNTRIAFDFLRWEEYSLSAYLLDPQIKTVATQFSLRWTVFPREIDPEVTSLLTKRFDIPAPENTPEGQVAILHAYIHAKHPGYFFIASNSLYEKLKQKYKNQEIVNGAGTINRLRKYLTPKDTANSIFDFQSPYILPDQKITLTKVYENDSYIVLKNVRI
ncbi:hypothetical protein [Nostoc sp. FACHB-280]|uniref:hypothetical protein n=1 Tax=Nostoc sp. FACHB-280 TaxID=2692839 RepID=UPI00168AB822|nr:hypothetical protein [Nostoc sp. FACHB-280]MBD2495226.1 hypothetical protein [Nostoc sp. FACHB-280]